MESIPLSTSYRIRGRRRRGKGRERGEREGKARGEKGGERNEGEREVKKWRGEGEKEGRGREVKGNTHLIGSPCWDHVKARVGNEAQCWRGLTWTIKGLQLKWKSESVRQRPATFPTTILGLLFSVLRRNLFKENEIKVVIASVSFNIRFTSEGKGIKGKPFIDQKVKIPCLTF